MPCGVDGDMDIFCRQQVLNVTDEVGLQHGFAAREGDATSGRQVEGFVAEEAPGALARVDPLAHYLEQPHRVLVQNFRRLSESLAIDIPLIARLTKCSRILLERQLGIRDPLREEEQLLASSQGLGVAAPDALQVASLE